MTRALTHSHTASVPVAPTTHLLDKYVLPKVALTVIVLASLVGTWLTMTTHGAGEWTQVVPRWLHLLGFATLAGGHMWKALFVRPPESAAHRDGFAQFAAGEFRLFRRIARVAVFVFVVGAVWDAARFAGWGAGTALVALDLGLAAAVAIVIGVDVFRAPSADPYAQRRPAVVALVLLVLAALAQGALDVTLAQGWAVGPLAVRGLHLAAFGLWLGGAFWNIFIAVPAAREIVSLPVVIAASQQLERFRVAVRIILPTLIVTGFVQAFRYVGWDLSGLTDSLFGYLILAKLGLIAGLIVIFLTCPMWRACSPIAGMCKLDDLYERKGK